MSQNIVSFYDSHEQAVAAVNLLKENGFNEKHISLLGKTDVGDDLQVKDAGIAAKGVGVGALVGVLAGVGLVAVPGIGVLYGIGALAGAIAGFDFGVIGGTIASVLMINNADAKIAQHYENQLKEGKTLLAVKRNKKKVQKAGTVLEGHGIHTELNLH